MAILSLSVAPRACDSSVAEAGSRWPSTRGSVAMQPSITTRQRSKIQATVIFEPWNGKSSGIEIADKDQQAMRGYRDRGHRLSSALGISPVKRKVSC
jgi:hypothetical protein